MSIHLVYEAVEGIREQADELLSRKETLDAYEQGLLFAYADSLGIIKGSFADYDAAELGLDFDIDQKYL